MSIESVLFLSESNYKSPTTWLLNFAIDGSLKGLSALSKSVPIVY